MASEAHIGTPIEFDWEGVSEDRSSALKAATRSDHVRGLPPTFATIYRFGEFEWLRRAGVDLRNLLHTEQEYEYLAPLPLGAPARVTTVLSKRRTRAGMTFVTLQSTIRFHGIETVRALSNFVLKGPVGDVP